MIRGLPYNGVSPVPADSPLQRDRDTASRPDGRTPGTETGVRRDTVDPERLERRVQARQAAEDAQLERFRADDVPLRNAQALDVFNNIASTREEGDDVELAGIDIRV
ncbi:UDP pyrophosphate phosphatase [Marinobacter sp. JSM 1782161]|uniref:UDP pyrophosphate phosphatase n=1 Tax=Marinobacter sp. JSM 1782161 TaxID=2685906 RepID=UPI001402CFBB|nr:UDP pyrophosphate phosphatase [Marinobacter sp. JSM 1782161]